MKAYTAEPIIIGRFGANPRQAYAVRCPSPDGWKTRAARLIGDGLNCKWSHRKGYTVSAAKFAKFERLYAEVWDASSFTGELKPPKATP